MVLDAKYKGYAEGSLTSVSREDLAQVISYMYIRTLPIGGFLVPGGISISIDTEYLNGEYGGKMILLNLPIASNADSYEAFHNAMMANERELAETISLIQE